MFPWRHPKNSLPAAEQLPRRRLSFKAVYLAYALLLIIVVLLLFAQLAPV